MEAAQHVVASAQNYHVKSQLVSQRNFHVNFFLKCKVTIGSILKVFEQMYKKEGPPKPKIPFKKLILDTKLQF